MIHVIGIGPGHLEGRTLEADRLLHEADVLVGYTAYLALLAEELPGKQTYATGMRAERERCEEALRLSRLGQRVAVCCSGDSQVYGMASLLLEMAEDTDEIAIVPGVTAALSAAALLGAPISGDFAVVSLSDLLTPWPVIERRLRAVAEGDFVLALYNPGSHTRTEHLARACDLLLACRDPETPCGMARNIGRDGQETHLLTLKQLRDEPADMLTTIIIGNSTTVLRAGRLVTPRGYRR